MTDPVPAPSGKRLSCYWHKARGEDWCDCPMVEPKTAPSVAETLTRALLNAWVRHPSTKPGEWGDPKNVFFSVERAVEVLAPVVSEREAQARAALRYIAEHSGDPVIERVAQSALDAAPPQETKK